MLLEIQLKKMTMTNINICCYSFSVSQGGVGGDIGQQRRKKIKLKTPYNISTYKFLQQYPRKGNFIKMKAKPHPTTTI